MNHIPLISVIVPVYNTAPFLDECLESIALQSCDNMEVTLIDDGSTDGSNAICRRRVERDGRFRLVECDNCGPSVARNAGIDVSRGEYVTFVDSDDVIARDYVTRLYAMMADADMAVTRVGGKMRHCDSEPLIMSRDDAMKSLLYQDGIDSSVSGKMFARHLFDEERFTPGIMYEDLDIMPRIIGRARRIVFRDEVLYFYRKRAGSRLSVFTRDRLDVLDVVGRIGEYVALNCPAASAAAKSRMLSAHFNMFVLLVRNGLGDSKEADACWDAISKLRMDCLRDKRVRTKNKLGIIASLPGRSFFKLLSRLSK